MCQYAIQRQRRSTLVVVFLSIFNAPSAAQGLRNDEDESELGIEKDIAQDIAHLELTKQAKEEYSSNLEYLGSKVQNCSDNEFVVECLYKSSRRA